ncbi:MAG: glycosyltransferase family 4 protein [Bacteroidota bacterium]
MKPRILIVNPFDPLPYEPEREGRYAYLARTLAQRGHEVIWLTSAWNHRRKAPRTPVIWHKDGLRVIAVRTPAYKDNLSWRRIMNHFVFGCRVRMLIPRLHCIAVAIISLPPLTPCLLLTAWLARRGIRTVLDIQDLWPEVQQNHLGPGGLLLAPLKWARSWALKKASLICAVSEDYRQRLHVQKTGLICHLGIDAAQVKRYIMDVAPDQTDMLQAAFTGSISYAYDLMTILAAAELAQKERLDIHFTIAGDGPLLPALRDCVAGKKLDNVTLTGYLPYEEICRLLVRADMALNAVKNNAMIYFPNKVFDYLAAGCFIVNSGQGEELSRILAQAQAGVSYMDGDPASLLNAIAHYRERYFKARAETKQRIMAVGMGYDRELEYLPLIQAIERLMHENEMQSKKTSTGW